MKKRLVIGSFILGTVVAVLVFIALNFGFKTGKYLRSSSLDLTKESYTLTNAVCYEKIYSNQQLKENPNQMVTYMSLYRWKKYTDGFKYPNGYVMAVKVRGDNKTHYTKGPCMLTGDESVCYNVIEKDDDFNIKGSFKIDDEVECETDNLNKLSNKECMFITLNKQLDKPTGESGTILMDNGEFTLNASSDDNGMFYLNKTTFDKCDF